MKVLQEGLHTIHHPPFTIHVTFPFLLTQIDRNRFRRTKSPDIHNKDPANDANTSVFDNT